MHPQDVAQLRADRRLALSGISDPRAGLSSSEEVEAYLGRDDVGGLAEDYFLDLDHRPDAPNVVLHVVESPLAEPPRLFSAADLFDRRGAFVTAAAAAGYTFPVLMRRIVDEAAARYLAAAIARAEKAPVEPEAEILSLAERRTAAE